MDPLNVVIHPAHSTARLYISPTRPEHVTVDFRTPRELSKYKTLIENIRYNVPSMAKDDVLRVVSLMLDHCNTCYSVHVPPDNRCKCYSMTYSPYSSSSGKYYGYDDRPSGVYDVEYYQKRQEAANKYNTAHEEYTARKHAGVAKRQGDGPLWGMDKPDGLPRSTCAEGRSKKKTAYEIYKNWQDENDHNGGPNWDDDNRKGHVTMPVPPDYQVASGIA
jgi:hypothetical protein